MMFLVRSAFWLGLVFSSMPVERVEIARALDQARSGLASDAVAAAKAECADRVLACAAIAASQASAAATPARSTATRATGSKDRSARPSANSLTADDLAAPWHGRNAKSGV